MGDFLHNVFTAWRDFQAWTPPTTILYPMLVLSAACAGIVSLFTAASRMFTLPISFISLLFAGNVSNFFARGIFMSGITDLQKTLIFTVLGNCIAALILLAIFKVSERR